MSHRSALTAAACALTASLVGALPARAQLFANAQSFCVPGAVGQCFGFAVTNADAGFDLWLRNLSATSDAAQSPFAIGEFSLRRVNAPTSDGRRTDFSAGFSNANVTTTGTALRGGYGLDENTSNADFPAARTFTYTSTGSYGLLGCAMPPAGLLAASGFVAITCADRGMDGWLHVAFGAGVYTELPAFAGLERRTATAADVAVEVAGCLAYVGAQSGVTGPWSGAAVCAAGPPTTAVVPEPATLWPVAAGLAGALAAAGARRRASRTAA